MKLHPRLTAEGVVLARRGERLRPVAERDGDGWVVGYGHRASAREGAAVTEGDALALLTWDLSRSAGRVEALLTRAAPQPLFDALNAYAFHTGPAAFAASDVLRRVNAGEAVAPHEVSTARAVPPPAPPSAVTAAADAVRDRLAQVLAEPEPPPPRPPREPWREPPPAPIAPLAPAASALQPPGREAAVSDFDLAAVAPRTEDGPPPVAAPPPAASPAEAPSSPPLAMGESEAVTPSTAAAAAPVDPAPDPDTDRADGSRLASAAPVGAVDAPAPTSAVAFARGGRARLWERVRADPRVYMAVGACGLALFVSALLGFLLGRPTAPGLALGVVGVICLAPALAFFLHRRRGEG